MVSVLRKVSLEDRYALNSGTVLLSGTQALVRLPLLQHVADVTQGLKTGGFITGYRGSPLGGLDQQLWGAKRHLDAAGIIFQPGVNEDLAATAIWGTQQAALLPGATVQGVFALWYGKGPGVDRAGDAIKHGNRMGTSRYGGVLLAVGDDHLGKSSTVAHQSEQALAANGVPVLYPASVQEYLDFGLLGWGLSRFAGVWVGLKCVNDTVETTATVVVDPSRVKIVSPGLDGAAARDLHARIAFDPLGDDVRLQSRKLPAAQAFAHANGLDRIVIRSRTKRLGLVSAGKSFLDVRAALRALGIDPWRAEHLGISLYKPGMIWPLEPTSLRAFARGFAELLVIEEKAAFLEPQIAQILFNLPTAERPRLIGKTDDFGSLLLPSDVALESVRIALLIAERLRVLDIQDAQVEARVAHLNVLLHRQQGPPATVVSRPPYFCSGCPHNTSTRVPQGSIALSGIGCHTMAMGMDRQTLPPTQMGGEGMTWAGIAPFTSMPHVFQNLGDGTYFHSGLLAIRAAVTAKLNITYKLLVNDAVAMTGGQPVEGGLAITEISRQLAAERVQPIAVVSDAPHKWRTRLHEFAPGVTLHAREELEKLQTHFRRLTGVSAIIYEQACAAEKRRRRKRGTLEDPDRRIFINARVCEGCGDCSTQSNCLSVEPLETELGRKRRINQSSCNKDYSCANGFCPSFVRVEGGTLRKPPKLDLDPALLAELTEPNAPATDSCSALIAGVGGTGVVTIGAILAMAAHLQGKTASVFDMTGLAQKGGAVLSHLRIGPFDDAPPTLGLGEADFLLACDLVVGAGPDALRTVNPQSTRLILNTQVSPVSQFQRDRDFDFQSETLLAQVRDVVAPGRLDEVNAGHIAEHVLGDAIATNMIMAGFAYQCGAMPLTALAIERAMELNGAAVELNRRAFRLGRLLQIGSPRFREWLSATLPSQVLVPETLDALITHRAGILSDYQDAAYADRYLQLVTSVRAAERAAVGTESLSEVVARNYFKLLAYKDEYEVARLYTDGTFSKSLHRQFAGDVRIKLLLAPPLWARRNPSTGEPQKRAFGQWILPVMRVLASLRRLRGTAFDPFGYTSERRLERQLIADYEHTVRQLVGRLCSANQSIAIEVAGLPDRIRGFGHIKARSIEVVRERQSLLMQRFAGESS